MAHIFKVFKRCVFFLAKTTLAASEKDYEGGNWKPYLDPAPVS